MAQVNQVEQKRLAHVSLALVSTFVIVVVMLIIFFFAIQHSRTVDNQKWCGLLSALDEPVPTNAPPRTKKISGEIHKLRLNHGCG